LFGTEHIITSKARGEWSKIHNLMEDLEIKSNNLLPESQKAIEMIIEKMKEEELN
jgi:hypothetical protein